jgi:hypothetical protein
MTAHARRTDPVTSHEAAASVQHITRTQLMILAALRERGPLTDEQLVLHFRGLSVASPSGLRSRRAELVEAGLVHPHGYGLTASGRRTIIWQATPKEMTLW